MQKSQFAPFYSLLTEFDMYQFEITRFAKRLSSPGIENVLGVSNVDVRPFLIDPEPRTYVKSTGINENNRTTRAIKYFNRSPYENLVVITPLLPTIFYLLRMCEGNVSPNKT
jgi:hypothetical protein